MNKISSIKTNLNFVLRISNVSIWVYHPKMAVALQSNVIKVLLFNFLQFVFVLVAKMVNGKVKTTISLGKSLVKNRKKQNQAFSEVCRYEKKWICLNNLWFGSDMHRMMMLQMWRASLKTPLWKNFFPLRNCLINNLLLVSWFNQIMLIILKEYFFRKGTNPVNWVQGFDTSEPYCCWWRFRKWIAYST